MKPRGVFKRPLQNRFRRADLAPIAEIYADESSHNDDHHLVLGALAIEKAHTPIVVARCRDLRQRYKLNR